MAVRSLNKVLLIGNLTRDPELRYTPQGTAVCTFGLATNRTWTAADSDEKQEETEFHRVISWSKLAEICSQLLYKGRKVYVEGRLQTRKWQTADGKDRETTEVVIDNMIALGAPRSGAPRGKGGNYDMTQEIVGEPLKTKQISGEVKARTVVDEQIEPSKDEETPAEVEKEEKVGKKASGDGKGKGKKTAEEKVSEDDIPF